MTQRVKSQRLLLGGLDLAHQAGLLQVSITPPAEEDGDPQSLSPNPSQGPTHPVDPDPMENPDLIQGPEAILDREVNLCLDPGLYLIPSQDHDQGTDQDLGHFLGPGQDQGLDTHPDLDLCRLGRGVFPDLQGGGRQ